MLLYPDCVKAVVSLTLASIFPQTAQVLPNGERLSDCFANSSVVVLICAAATVNSLTIDSSLSCRSLLYIMVMAQQFFVFAVNGHSDADIEAEYFGPTCRTTFLPAAITSSAIEPGTSFVPGFHTCQLFSRVTDQDSSICNHYANVIRIKLI